MYPVVDNCFPIAFIMATILTAFLIVLSIPLIIFEWKTYKKLGLKGWYCLIPVYNMWSLSSVLYKKGSYGLLCLLSLTAYIPFIGWILGLVSNIFILCLSAKMWADASVAMGGPWWLGIVVAAVPLVGFGILAFSKDAVYDNMTFESPFKSYKNTAEPSLQCSDENDL